MLKQHNYYRQTMALISALMLSVLASADTLKVVLYDGGSPPLFFAKGDPNTGIYVDLLTEIGRISGHQFEFQYAPTKRAMLLFEEGVVNLEVGINPAWRSTSSVPGEYTIAFGQSEDVVLFQTGKERVVNNADDLIGAKVGTIKGFYYPGYMQAFADAKISRKDSLDEDKLMQKMANRRLDAAFIRKEAALYRIKIDPKFKDLMVGDVIGSADIMLRIHPSKASVIESINAAITTLQKNAGLQQIYSRYR